MRDELVITGNVTILSFSNSDKVIIRINWECPLVVFLVLQPVEELNDDGTSERPLEAVIVLTFQDVSKDRQVAVLTTTITISIHIETHYITLLAGGEWWTVVLVVELLAFGIL